MFRIVLFGCLAFLVPASALPQTHERPVGTRLEITGGYAGFGDEGVIAHAVIGGAARVYLSPRLSVGPEIVYMIGPDGDRDLMLTGNVTFDLLRPMTRVMPFLVGGAGLFHSTLRIGPFSYSTSEGAFTGGGGVRVHITDRIYAASEFRLGWEPHFRISGTIGIAVP